MFGPRDAQAHQAMEAFLKAVSDGDLDKISETLRQDLMFVNAQNEAGQTALLVAAAASQAEVVSTLLSFGANVQCISANMNTVLHFAAETGNVETCQVLKKHCDSREWSSLVNARNINFDRPLMFAALRGNVEVVRFLLDAGADPLATNGKGATALHHAASCGGLPDPLLNHSTPSSKPTALPVITHMDEQRALQLVQLLLNTCPKLMDMADKQGNTALHRFAIRSALCVEELISRGANLAARNTVLKIAWDCARECPDAPQRCKDILEKTWKELNNTQGVLAQRAQAELLELEAEAQKKKHNKQKKNNQQHTKGTTKDKEAPPPLSNGIVPTTSTSTTSSSSSSSSPTNANNTNDKDKKKDSDKQQDKKKKEKENGCVRSTTDTKKNHIEKKEKDIPQSVIQRDKKIAGGPGWESVGKRKKKEKKDVSESTTPTTTTTPSPPQPTAPTPVATSTSTSSSTQHSNDVTHASTQNGVSEVAPVVVKEVKEFNSSQYNYTKNMKMRNSNSLDNGVIDHSTDAFPEPSVANGHHNSTENKDSPAAEQKQQKKKEKKDKQHKNNHSGNRSPKDEVVKQHSNADSSDNTFSGTSVAVSVWETDNPSWDSTSPTPEQSSNSQPPTADTANNEERRTVNSTSSPKSKTEIESAFAKFQNMEQQFRELHPRADIVGLDVSNLIGIGTCSLSMSQLEILGEIFSQLAQKVNDAKIQSYAFMQRDEYDATKNCF